MSSSLITVSTPFSDQARQAWYEPLLKTGGNRFRPSLERILLIRDLINGVHKPGNVKEHRLSHKVRTRYRLDNNRLQIQPRGDGTFKNT